MKQDKTVDERADAAQAGSADANLVEMAGETTAAATGSAEIGAAGGETTSGEPRPVGADTMVKVADSKEEG